MSRIEVLKEAGADIAILCRTLAMELSYFRTKYEDQLPCDWTDEQLNISAKEIATDGVTTSVVAVDFAGHAQVYVPSLTFSKLRSRFLGVPNQFLGSIFTLVKRYETKKMIVSGTVMDFHLTPSTLSSLERELKFTIELWTDPISVHGNKSFCGMFMDIDACFGALPPFGNEEGVGESTLMKNGGSVAVLPPLDSKISSMYMRQILNILEHSEGKGIPLSFALFLPMQCFRDLNSVPGVENLSLLDNRLMDRHRFFIACLRVLEPGHHKYDCGDGDGHSEVCQTGSIFLLLQNESGRIHYPFNANSISNITSSMMVPFLSTCDGGSICSAPAVFPNSLHTKLATSPNSKSGTNVIDYSMMGGKNNPIVFSTESKSSNRRRLFELVDDGDDDNNNDVEMVSGILNSLDFSMFHTNSTQDVDIEAISLMGIDGVNLGLNDNSLHHHSRFR